MKIVCISDTHGEHRKLNEVPDGDVLIHAGDFTKHGKVGEAEDFLAWFNKFPHEYKVLVAGNHDFVMAGVNGRNRNKIINLMDELGVTYLQDESTEIMGKTVYGSPYSNTFDSYVFNEEMPEIEEDVDILVTHGPPSGVLDTYGRDRSAGSPEISREVDRVDPELHVFGHIHECHGKEDFYVNASVLDEEYHMYDHEGLINPPVVVNL